MADNNDSFYDSEENQDSGEFNRVEQNTGTVDHPESPQTQGNSNPDADTFLSENGTDAFYSASNKDNIGITGATEGFYDPKSLSGSTVEPNPPGTDGDDLLRLGVDGINFNIPTLELATASSGLTGSFKLKTNLGGKSYFLTAQEESYPQFGIGISGAPNTSSAFVTQSDFSISADLASGTLTEINSINTNVETGGSTSPHTFTGSLHSAVGTYTATVNATGASLDPISVTATKSASRSWSRFIPAYWVVSNTEPTALPSASSGVSYGSYSVSGSANTTVYLITTNSDFRFNVGPYEVFENLVGTITGQEDKASNSHDFNVYKMGKIPASGSATFTLA